MGGLTWRVARVLDTHQENASARSLHLHVPGWPGHRPGQHVDVRLTDERGDQAARSYSIASTPQGEHLTLTVVRVQDGEVSPYLVDDARPGDQFEVLGPIGGYFVWDAPGNAPLLLVAGGSGLVPLMCMLRARFTRPHGVPAALLYSLRAPDDTLFAHELDDYARRDASFVLTRTYTRTAPPGWTGLTGRVGATTLATVTTRPAGTPEPTAFVCGPTGFVERVARTLVELGFTPDHVRTERFGPTGRTA
ncbi:ferredoxin reductase [Deinococcus pimensis]|uniref:ferredoxin reductase n=1 Tax=Deinococcus pimensis TaxID=309888 RepID=UPI0004B61532|nr:ferredoxin reductase [Deinococcus pimensis]